MLRMKAPAADLYRKLPSVDELLREPAVASLVALEGTAVTTAAARTVLARLRTEIAEARLDSAQLDLALGGIVDAIDRELRQSLAFSLQSVINATGVILHTNLGRAPLADATIEQIRATTTQYSNLEFDIASGERGKRDVHVQRLFARLLGDGTGTVVVNNNAAAVLLALNTLAEGGEALVSRGELVEIGESFRVPDVMQKAGATLREVGTTNRTRIADYERAITERTRLLLRVHRSNFEIVGFTEQPSLEELVALGRKRNLPVVEDLGSGALVDLHAFGLAGEPSVVDSLHAGVDVVTYSGDKLLGGPQAGLLSGRKEFIARIRQNPLFRALRVDKLTYAALAATLLAYVRQDHDAIPALHMMRLTPEQVGLRAGTLAAACSGGKLRFAVINGESVVGGGAAPGATLPTRLVAITAEDLTADELATRLRQNVPSIVARVEEGRVLLDLRTVFPHQDAALRAALLVIGA